MVGTLGYVFSILVAASLVAGMRTKIKALKKVDDIVCSSWCPNNTNTWETKCLWKKCGACDECNLDSTAGDSTSGDATTGDATATPECNTWCPGNKQTWETKCTWKTCGACDDCTVPSPTPFDPTAKHTPFDVMTCPGAPVLTTSSMSCEEYDAVVTSVTSRLNALSAECDATTCPQADWAGCVLRVAGHDFMDFADGQGGSDACTDMSDPDNAGLAACLHKGEFGTSLKDAYAEHCSSVSLADFLVIAAEAVMVETRKRVNSSDSIDFRSNFKYGRTTAETCDFAEGRLPNPERSCTAVDETFVQRMGLSWRQSAALMGVHTLGRASVANSGYDGFWSDAENSRRFNNNYYVSILAKGWMPEKAINGNSGKNQWQRVDHGKDGQATLGKEMMLDTDMCLAFTEDNDGAVELRAETSDCCAWVSPRFMQRAGYDQGKFCGSTNIPGRNDFREQRGICCDGNDRLEIDCGLANEPKGPAFDDVVDFAVNEWRWLMVFQEAWTIATSNGQGTLKSLPQCGR